ncbi:MAG TPA: cytochrome C [Blastocatellia bacterium]|nr:cytochrome C [Blastocatellia bacterium]
MKSRTITHARRLSIAAAILFLSTFYAACNGDVEREASMLTGGDPVKGRTAIRTYGCDSCHTIPGVRGATSLVGPPLNRMADRGYIGGVLPNTPENMIRWIQDPQGVDHLTAMPNVGVTDSDARDIAGYLYTLR